MLEQGLVGRTERQVATTLEAAMRDLGAQRPSFDSIVAVGPHGALPHAQPRDVRSRPGSSSSSTGAPSSTATARIARGRWPLATSSEAAREVYELVRRAQLAGLDGRSGRGVGGREADAAARQVIAQAGHADHFGHGLGHGVGHGDPRGPAALAAVGLGAATGNVVTVEPGVYLPGKFGVRIEDLTVVTEDGCEILTSLPKDLITVG